MADEREFDLKEYLEAKFAEQTKLHESHAGTTAALFKSIENKLDGVERKVEGVDGKVEGVDGKVEGLGSKLDGVGRKLDALDKRVRDLQWFIGIIITITVVAMAGIAVISFTHTHAQEVTSRNCCETQRTNLGH